MGNNLSGNKRIARNTLFLYIRLAFVLVISLYTSRVVLKALGVVDFGIYNVVAGFVSMFALLSTSLTNSVQRFYNYEVGKNGVEGMKKIYTTSFYIQLIIAILVLLFAETIGLWYLENKMVIPTERQDTAIVVFQVSVLSLLFVILQIPYSAAIIARERIDYYAIVGVIDVVLKLIVAIFLTFVSGDHLKLYSILIGGVAIINFVLYYTYAKHHFSFLRFERTFHKETFKAMLRFSGWSAVNGVSQTVKNQGINLLMNLYFGPVINAARGISYQIKSALLGFVLNITTAAQPQIVESYAAGDINRSKQLMFSVSKFVFLSLYLVALPVMIEIHYILRLWLGNEVPDYTEIFVVLILIITLIDILCSPINIIINASGRIGLYNFCVSVIGMTILPLAYIALGYDAQPEYVYIVSLILSVIILIAAVIIMRRKTNIGITEYISKVLTPITFVSISTFFIPLLVSFLMEEGIVRLMIVTLVSFICVFVFGFYFGLNHKERSTIISFVKKHI